MRRNPDQEVGEGGIKAQGVLEQDCVILVREENVRYNRLNTVGRERKKLYTVQFRMFFRLQFQSRLPNLTI